MQRLALPLDAPSHPIPAPQAGHLGLRLRPRQGEGRERGAPTPAASGSKATLASLPGRAARLPSRLGVRSCRGSRQGDKKTGEISGAKKRQPVQTQGWS